MSDLISRQAVIDALADMHCKSDEDGYVWIIRSDAWARIDALPSAQSERGKGRWLNINESEKWECSECSRIMWFSPRLGVKPSDYRFCPNCGARMTEDV